MGSEFMAFTLLRENLFVLSCVWLVMFGIDVGNDGVRILLASRLSSEVLKPDGGYWPSG